MQAGIAPDASRSDDRTLVMEYNPCNGGLEIYRRTPLDHYSYTMERICFVKDNYLSPSYGVFAKVKQLEFYSGRTVEQSDYMKVERFHLHDTPVVRSIIEQIDNLQCGRLSDSFNETLKALNVNDQELKALVPLPNGDLFFLPVKQLRVEPR